MAGIAATAAILKRQQARDNSAVRHSPVQLLLRMLQVFPPTTQHPLWHQWSAQAELLTAGHTCWQKGNSTRLGLGYGLSSRSSPCGLHWPFTVADDAAPEMCTAQRHSSRAQRLAYCCLYSMRLLWEQYYCLKKNSEPRICNKFPWAVCCHQWHQHKPVSPGQHVVEVVISTTMAHTDKVTPASRRGRGFGRALQG